MACTIPLRIDSTKDVSESGIYKVLQHVKPEWTGNIEIKPLGGGFINKIWLCSCQGDQLVIRVNPDDERLPFVDRDYEALTTQYMASLKLVPKYYGRLQNGLVYQYAKGVNPSIEDMENEDLMKLIIDRIYRIHSSGVPKKNTYSAYKIDSVFHHFTKEVAEAADESKFEPDLQKLFLSAVPPTNILREEAAICRNNMELMYKSFPHVFCHHDLWRMNIVYDKEAQIVEILDWEHADYGPAAQDLAGLAQVYDEETTLRKWIRLYLERAGIPQDEDIVSGWYTCMLHSLSEKYLGCCFWALWNIPLAQDKQQQMSLVDLAIEMYDNYMQVKKRGHQDNKQ